MLNKNKLVRIATVSVSLNILLKGQLKFLNSTYEVIAVSGHDENLSEVKFREGFRTHSIEMQRQISPWKD